MIDLLLAYVRDNRTFILRSGDARSPEPCPAEAQHGSAFERVFLFMGTLPVVHPISALLLEAGPYLQSNLLVAFGEDWAYLSSLMISGD